MKRFLSVLSACAALGLFCPPLGVAADEPTKQEKKADPAKDLAALQKEWADAQQAYFKALGEAKTNEDRQKVLKEKQPKQDDFAERFLKLAETHPDTPEASQAVVWIFTNARNTKAGDKVVGDLKKKVTATTNLAQLHKTLAGLPGYNLSDLAPLVAEKAKKNLDDPHTVPLLMWVCSATAYVQSSDIPELAKLYNDTVDLLVDRFVERKELAPLANWLASDDDAPWAEKNLRRLMEKNPDVEVKASAKFGLASFLAKKDAESQPEAEKLFQSLIDDSDRTLPTPENRRAAGVLAPLAEKAKNELAEMKGPRALGKPVPDVAGDDLDGKSFKLSDYKGKVVLLDFWGFW